MLALFGISLHEQKKMRTLGGMKNKIFLNDAFYFSPEFDEKMLLPSYRARLEKVRIPHSVVQMPLNDFDESCYQLCSAYRTTFFTQPAWKGMRVLLTVEGAAHKSEVFLNGKNLASHCCGYTAFTVDLTEHLSPAGKNNVLVIRLDSRETLDQPPFGFVVDYMTFGGIYRDVYLQIKSPVYIQDVAVTTKEQHFSSAVRLSTEPGAAGFIVRQSVVPCGADGAVPVSECETGAASQTVLTAMDVAPVVRWSLEQPALYLAVTELVDFGGHIVDTHVVRFGFRDIVFNADGFFLNGKKIKLRGLNRHQSFPYVGYAMPKNMQRDDADILKYEIGLNEVRTSHYPQSQHFIDRCDEIGLLVFTEIPGWQHIGGGHWQELAVQNVRDMVVQYRNHPSIFLWGVRINESLDNDALYEKTNEAARTLDATRPTGGVRYLRHSHLLEDVYTFNDFSHYGPNAGCLKKSDVTETDAAGYMITEYNGHMFPTKSFDDEGHRTEHALRHARVLDAVASSADCAGASGWCAFDYNTHQGFGSGDRVCYHGVMDMFRNPKQAAAVYKSQQDASVVGDVLEVSSGMDIGEYPASVLGPVWVYTNADYVRLYINDIVIKDYHSSDSPFAHLAHGPILIDDFIGNRLVDEEHYAPEDARALKAIICAIQKHGESLMPFRLKMKAFWLGLRGVASKKRISELFGKYLGSWGGSVSTYRFEAFRNGELVKTVVKVPGKTVRVSAAARRTLLVEDETYDVSAISLTARDEWGNIRPYMQEAVLVEASGAVSVIGPAALSLKGGMAAVYVKTLGKSGKGAVTITDWNGAKTKIAFTVRVKKL